LKSYARISCTVKLKFVIFVPTLLKSAFMLQHWLKDLVERHAFGACQYLGEKMHVAPGEVRKYFIYTSFIGMGSPLIIYLFVAFWVNFRRYIRRGKSVIWE
jgi:hypothetical protein